MARKIVISVLLAAFALGLQDSAGVSRVSKGSVVSFERMLLDLRSADVIFIGETHADPEHHRLQERIIRSLHESGVPIAIGLEMFRADDQRTLNEWVAGSLRRDRFIRRYYDNWSLPWPLYEDIFLYAREHRIPLVGLNIPEEISDAVAKDGFSSLTRKQRAAIPAGITCNVDPRYREFIRQAYAGHLRQSNKSFDTFCEAQLLWDRIMARNIAGFREQHGDMTVVVLTGLGHAWRRGIPEQLATYAKLSSRVVLPSLPGETGPVTSGDADYIVAD